MTTTINPQNQNIPAYSGITINITNPTLNPPPICQNCTVIPPSQQNYENNTQYNIAPSQDKPKFNSYDKENIEITNAKAQNIQERESTNENKKISQEELQTLSYKEQLPQSYPTPYYLNNYNYIQNGEKGNSQALDNRPKTNNNGLNFIEPQEDLTASTNIISDIDNRIAEQKELEKHGKQTKVVALTNEYIMSLENYLNNPNTEIRLMAAKEVLTRLDEDKNRYNDAALNALLNKMLQDPAKLVRIAALSAFSSQLASGNDYTIKLLTNIQNNPNGDKEDALQAANSLLRMSSRTEIKYVPAKKDNNKKSSNKELEESQKQVQQLKEQLNKYKEKEVENYIKTSQGK